MDRDIDRILLTKEEISDLVQQIAGQIDAYYRSVGVSEIIVIGVLNGAAPFTADLIRALKTPLRYDFVRVSSYRNAAVSGELRFLKDVEIDVVGQHILMVDDIIDTGNTLKKLESIFKERGAASYKICAFLDKQERRTADIDAHFIGQVIPDSFVVGYGLDYDERYRQLPYVGILKREVYEK